jgi:hypothetical protein
MQFTPEFRTLERNLRRLEKHFLPPQLSPTGDYTIRWQDRIAAYVVMSHAEIESYLEECGKSVAREAKGKWDRQKEIGKPLLALLAFSGLKLEPPPPKVPLLESNNHKPEIISIEGKIGKCYSIYINIIRKNNGIKEENILSILMPIGIGIDDIRNELINDLNTLGIRRGDIVHTSVSRGRVENTLDPRIQRDLIRRICDQLKDIDALTQQLR